MEKSNIKEKHNKEINKKNKNNSFIFPEEYIKMLDKNKTLMEFGEKIYNLYSEIKNATREYCEKLNQITKQLNPNTQNNIGILQKIINDILINSTNAIDKAINLFEQEKNTNINLNFFEDYKNKIDEFKKEYQEKSEVLNITKKAYFEEMNKYEVYLINKELKLDEKTNDNENNIKDNKKKDKKKDKINSLNNNHKKAYEQQEKYINAKNDLKISLQKMIFYINAERKYVFQSLNQSCETFIKSIKLYIANLKKIIEEEKNVCKEHPINNDEDLIKEEDMINTILKDELYSFKFLSYERNIYEEEDSKNKKKKKDKNDNLKIDNLLEQLKIDNMMRIIKELEHHKIIFNEDNSNKISVLENKLIIESLTDFIINNPIKFKDDNKNNLISLLKINRDNQNSFMQFLNNYRAKGLFVQKKETIIILCDLFTFIIEMAVKNNDYKIIQYAIILSSTYCYIDENSIKKDKKKAETDDDDDDKIYMSHYLKKSKIFKEKSFWLNYMKELINDELEKITLRKENSFNQKQKDFAVYSSVFALIKNMIDFDLDFNFINDELTDIFAQYKFKDTEKLDIINYLIEETRQKGQKSNEEKK